MANTHDWHIFVDWYVNDAGYSVGAFHRPCDSAAVDAQQITLAAIFDTDRPS
jgi:hypothetical protein